MLPGFSSKFKAVHFATNAVHLIGHVAKQLCLLLQKRHHTCLQAHVARVGVLLGKNAPSCNLCPFPATPTGGGWTMSWFHDCHCHDIYIYIYMYEYLYLLIMPLPGHALPGLSELPPTAPWLAVGIRVLELFCRLLAWIAGSSSTHVVRIKPESGCCIPQLKIVSNEFYWGLWYW